MLHEGRHYDATILGVKDKVRFRVRVRVRFRVSVRVWVSEG